MDIQTILKFLPHRYPFLLVDKVLEYEINTSILAIKNVTINEHFFAGHFPIKPVMPGVLILEALAQTAAILASQNPSFDPKESLFYLGGIDGARFKRMVMPGDQLYLKIDVLRRRANVWKFKCTATVSGEIACVAEMTCAEGKVEL